MTANRGSRYGISRPGDPLRCFRLRGELDIPERQHGGRFPPDCPVGIVEDMTDADPSFGRLWRYQFSQPDETVVDTGEFNGNDTAEAKARELSQSKDSPIVVKRHSAHVDDWVYVTEVDERPSCVT